jgi:hypothetical protein
VTELSYPLGQLARVTYDDVGPNLPAIEGDADIGLPFFNGGAGYSADLFGSPIPSGSTTTHNVEIRFTGASPGQYAYRYLRGGGVYMIQDYVPVPFTVWDTDANQQLNAGFLENNGSPTQDGQWDPDANAAALGEREIVWIFDDAYSGDNTPNTVYLNDPNLQDMLSGNVPTRYALWPLRTSPGAVIDNGDKISYTTSVPATPNDYFTFSTTTANRFNATIAKSELDRVLAVPNPYFTHSTFERSQFSRIVKFTHLPANCTLRLFNMSGDLVRILNKSDNTSQISWDLLTDRGLPVSSGVYIFHVDAPGVGTKVGKVVIFMEKERLNTF